MKKLLLMLLCVTILIFVVAGTGAHAAGVTERGDLEKYFEGFNGTFVLYDQENDKYIVYNELRSNQRLTPCSTFKIYNSLIGLESGVLDREDVFTLYKWDGTNYNFPYWNHDHTLASATQESVVWYFKRLAANIGQERMQEYIDKIGYGNQDISGGLTNFWLGSSLTISAREQVDLLNKVLAGETVFSPDVVEIVKKNITQSERNGVRFMGKTGSRMELDGRWTLGWFVGAVEKDGKRYIFATNIEGRDGAIGGKAREITKVVLAELGIL